MSSHDPIQDRFESEAEQQEDLVPGVEVPDPAARAEGSEADVRSLFWRLVFTFNVALFGVTVGPMVVYFEGDLHLGGGLFVVGLIASGGGFVRYWQFRRERRTERDDRDGEPTADR